MSGYQISAIVRGALGARVDAVGERAVVLQADEVDLPAVALDEQLPQRGAVGAVLVSRR